LFSLSGFSSSRAERRQLMAVPTFFSAVRWMFLFFSIFPFFFTLLRRGCPSVADSKRLHTNFSYPLFFLRWISIFHFTTIVQGLLAFSAPLSCSLLSVGKRSFQHPAPTQWKLRRGYLTLFPSKLLSPREPAFPHSRLIR